MLQSNINILSPRFSHPSENSSRPGLTRNQLNPTVALRRLRPVRLRTFAQQLESYTRTADALLLLTQFFPEALEGYATLSYPVWWEILTFVLRSAETAGWFEVDWQDFNNRLRVWETNKAERGDLLANFLRYIPIKQYGFAPHLISRYPPMELMYILLSEDEAIESISSDLLITLEIYDQFDDEWTKAERQAAWARLRDVEENPDQYPELVRELPNLARWATHTTGNPLLDWPPLEWIHNHLRQPQHFYRFSWDDVSLVRMLWRQVQPIIGQLKHLAEWVEQDENRLLLLFNFFAEGDCGLLAVCRREEFFITIEKSVKVMTIMSELQANLGREVNYGQEIQNS
ncbi:MAG: hypothetical protein DPW09_01955 [Anaerolineae bacterium]|nr:hypothetical protein [Anaerolineae bacterium]MCQ3972192.1 hypothetical protein [Anaerolineae bacterium]